MDSHGIVFLEACNAGIFQHNLSFFSYEKKYARNPKHHYLYRYPFVYFLFKDDDLVYIGSTVNLPNRIAGHMGNGYIKFDTILAVMFHHFGINEYPIRKAEEKCINLFRPRRNIQYNPDYAKRGRQWVYLPELESILKEEKQTT